MWIEDQLAFKFVCVCVCVCVGVPEGPPSIVYVCVLSRLGFCESRVVPFCVCEYSKSVWVDPYRGIGVFHFPLRISFGAPTEDRLRVSLEINI